MADDEADRDEFDGDEDEDDHGMLWEEEAWDAIKVAIDHAEVDDVRGTVVIHSNYDHRYDAECDSFEDLSDTLVELYNEQWYANVPFEGGEAVFESDAAGEVDNLLAGTKFESFFTQIRKPKDADEEIISSHELVGGPAESRIIRGHLTLISAEIAEYFARHPEKLRTEIDPEDFERLMEAVFRNQGFDVERTKFSKDGGVDLILVRKSSVGAAMTLVDCKQYGERHKVGVDIVRGMYGVVEDQKATSGMVVTTSWFTKGAVDFRDKNKYRMELADFKRVKEFLEVWKR